MGQGITMVFLYSSCFVSHAHQIEIENTNSNTCSTIVGKFVNSSINMVMQLQQTSLVAHRQCAVVRPQKLHAAKTVSAARGGDGASKTSCSTRTRTRSSSGGSIIMHCDGGGGGGGEVLWFWFWFSSNLLIF